MTSGSCRSKARSENSAQRGDIALSTCATVGEFERCRICRAVRRSKRDSKLR